jgi:FAD/FMN-containing dehydrogenase
VTTNHVVDLHVLLPDGSHARLGSPEGETLGTRPGGPLRGQRGDVRHRARDHPAADAPAAGHPHPARRFPDGARRQRSGERDHRAGHRARRAGDDGQACIRAIEASIYAAGYPTDAGAILLVELDGQAASVAAESADVEALLLAAGARGVRAASTPLERAKLWQGRKKAFGAAGRIAPDLVVQDAVVPRSACPTFWSGSPPSARATSSHQQRVPCR